MLDIVPNGCSAKHVHISRNCAQSMVRIVQGRLLFRTFMTLVGPINVDKCHLNVFGRGAVLCIIFTSVGLLRIVETSCACLFPSGLLPSPGQNSIDQISPMEFKQIFTILIYSITIIITNEIQE